MKTKILVLGLTIMCLGFSALRCLYAEEASVYYNLGVVYGETGEWEKAIKEYEMAIELEPDYINAYYNLGIAYGNMDRWEDAATVYERLINIEPDDADAHYNLGLVYIILNNPEAAYEEYGVLIKIAPDHANKLGEVISYLPYPKLNYRAWINAGKYFRYKSV